MTKLITTAAAALAMVSPAAAQQSQLATVFSSHLVVNGATTSPDGRLFLAAQPSEPGTTPQVVEVRDGKALKFLQELPVR